MEDQTRFGRARTGRCQPGLRAAVTGAVALLAVMACGGPSWQTTRAVRPDERAHQTYCSLQRDTEPQGRVINYVDPELCGRHVRDRSEYAVRVPPIVRPSTEKGS